MNVCITLIYKMMVLDMYKTIIYISLDLLGETSNKIAKDDHLYFLVSCLHVSTLLISQS